MKQSKLARAYKVLNDLGQQRLPSMIAYKLFKLKKQLQPVWDFQVEQEQQIFEMYPPVQKEDNAFKFESPEQKKGFLDAFDELNNMESDLEITPINVPLLPEMRLSGNDLEILEDLVFFTTDEPENP